jgi:hypothetical protein
MGVHNTMAEIARLTGRGTKGEVTLVLTDTHLQLEPSPEFREEIEEAFQKGREGAQEAPGVIGWFVEKVMNFASNMVDKVYTPHELEDVELLFRQDRVVMKLGRLQMHSELEVTPEQAYMFEALFRRAKEAAASK